LAKRTAAGRPRPEEDDLAAALRCLTLLFPDGRAKAVVRQAHSATCARYIAKAIWPKDGLL
jgi:hypothetical protein